MICKFFVQKQRQYREAETTAQRVTSTTINMNNEDDECECVCMHANFIVQIFVHLFDRLFICVYEYMHFNLCTNSCTDDYWIILHISLSTVIA